MWERFTAWLSSHNPAAPVERWLKYGLVAVVVLLVAVFVLLWRYTGKGK